MILKSVRTKNRGVLGKPKKTGKQCKQRERSKKKRVSLGQEEGEEERGRDGWKEEESGRKGG